MRADKQQLEQPPNMRMQGQSISSSKVKEAENEAARRQVELAWLGLAKNGCRNKQIKLHAFINHLYII